MYPKLHKFIGIKLTIHKMKLWERTVEGKLRYEINISEN